MNRMLEGISAQIDIQDLRAMPYGERKAKYFRGNYLLAASEAFDWYSKRSKYIKEQALQDGGDLYEGRMKAYNLEIEEVKEARAVLKQIPDPTLSDEWKLASEWADVMIIGASIMRARRMTIAQVAEIWQTGKYQGVDSWGVEHVGLVRQYQQEAESYGLDLAEMIINKLAGNDQHYNAAFLPVALVQSKVDGMRQSSFAREMRLTVGGNSSSQIPPMVTSRFGELWIDRMDKSPYGTNGGHPTAISIKDGEISLSDGDMPNTYDKLYAIGWLSKYGD